MDDNRLQQHLYAIAEEEIPDVNLLPEIQAKLKQPISSSGRTTFNLSRMAASIALFLIMGTMIGAAGYAMLQHTLHDPTVPPDDITSLDMSQTIGDATVTLDWVYADAHRITLSFTETSPLDHPLTGLQTVELRTADGRIIPQAFGHGGGGGGGTGQTQVQTSHQFNFDASVLTGSPEALNLILELTYNGVATTYDPLPGMGGGGGGGGGGVMPTVPPPSECLYIVQRGDTIASLASTFDVDTDAFVQLNNLNANVPLNVGDELINPDCSYLNPANNSPVVATPIPVGGGGGGGGGVMPTATFTATPIQANNKQPLATATFTATPIPAGGINAMPTVVPTIPPPAERERVFTFEFSVPFYPALATEPDNATVTDAGLTMRVNNIRVAPSLTKFDLCYEYPENDDSWNLVITVDGGAETFGYGFAVAPLDNADDDLYCYNIEALAAIAPDAETLIIHMDSFNRPMTDPITPELARTEENRLEADGYIVELDVFERGGYGMQILDYPDTVTEEDAYLYVSMHLFNEIYDGDWIFTAPLD